jgi:hypothetical protein
MGVSVSSEGFPRLHSDSFCRIAKSSAAVRPFFESMAVHRVPWTSGVSLFRFVWAIRRGSVMGIGPESDSSRAALATWIRKFNIIATDSGSGAPALSVDEAMLDWLVFSVRRGCTHEGVLV